MSDRDPRLDPRAGDVLRHKVGCRTREVSSVIRDSVSTWDVGVDGVRRSNVISTLKQWLRWAAGAEVLRVAEEVQGE